MPKANAKVDPPVVADNPLVPPVVVAAPANESRGRSRALILAAICGLCLLLAGGYTARAIRARHGSSAVAGPVATNETLAQLSSAARLTFVRAADNPVTAPGQVALLPLAQRDSESQGTAASCARVYITAGRGLCLTIPQGFSTVSAFTFDQQFRTLHTLPVSGFPSRARISPDGRYGAMTFFLYGGHSYSGGNYVTQTTLVDMNTGDLVADLENFTILRDGARIQSADFNFWGVTFARDSNRFYATLGTAGKIYLIEGDIAGRQAHVLRENVECPSLSPDNTRLVFKKRIEDGPPAVWRLYALDLATMKETPLAETRSVDDQVEWLDDHQILYTPPLPRPEIWAVPADGSGSPRMLVSNAVSPVVVR